MSGPSEPGSSPWFAECNVERIRAVSPIDCRPGLDTDDGFLDQVRSIIRDDRRRAALEGGIWAKAAGELSIPMKGKSGGLTRFEIIGITLEQLVFATWDGGPWSRP